VGGFALSFAIHAHAFAQAHEEVRVRGPRRDVGAVTVPPSETRIMPGAFGDAFRFVDATPGVVAASSGLQAPFVRGAPPNATVAYVDGVRVPALYHVGYGPGVINSALLEAVTFYPGAPPARFGRFTGGVLSGETSRPSTTLRGGGTLRLYDAGAYAEAPIASGRGSVFAGARYSYPTLLLLLIAPRVDLTFWDYQARTTYRVSDSDEVSILAFGSRDVLGEKDPAKQLLLTDFHRVDLRYDRVGPRDRARIAVTLGRDVAGDAVANGAGTMFGTRALIERDVSTSVRARFGADMLFDALEPGTVVAGGPLGGSRGRLAPRDDLALGMHADAQLRLGPRVDLTPGLRTDVLTTRGSEHVSFQANASAVPTVDPRIATRVALTDRVALVSTFGLAHQRPGLAVPTADSTDILNRLMRPTGIQSSVQTSQGVDLTTSLAILSVAGFYHRYEGLVDLTTGCEPDPATRTCRARRSSARSVGLEVTIKRPLTSKIGLLFAYTLSRATREAHLTSEPQVAEVATEFDRTHVLSAIGSWTVTPSIRVGARFVGYSGRPFSRTYLGFPVEPYNAERLPGFYRIDLRAEKSWRIGTSGRVALVLEGLNVTANKETIAARCEPPPSAPRGTLDGRRPPGAPLDPCTFERFGPITIPSIGVEGSF
jgi:hypothetical protein